MARPSGASLRLLRSSSLRSCTFTHPSGRNRFGELNQWLQHKIQGETQQKCRTKEMKDACMRQMFTNLSIWAPARLTVRYGIRPMAALVGPSFHEAEPLEGTVVGVQGQQMLVCAQDGAHLLRRHSSHPSRSQKHRSVRPVCSERQPLPIPFLKKQATA